MTAHTADSEKYVVGIGEVLFDCLPTGRQIGGAPANFAYHASQFGLRGMVVSATGADSLGDEARRLLTQKRLGLCLETVPFPTGTVQVTLDDAGVPRYDICPDVAYDHIPFTPEIEQIARRTACVCFGSLAQRFAVSHHSIMRFLQAMPTDAMKVFDINLRQDWYTKAVIEQSLQQCNILKINDEEVVTVAQMLQLHATGHSLHGERLESHCRTLMRRYHIGMVVLTCGAKGSTVLTSNEISRLQAPKVEIADTVGAGDAFTGAFCASLLLGKPVAEAHRIATEVAAFVCTQSGAMPTLPPRLVKVF